MKEIFAKSLCIIYPWTYRESSIGAYLISTVSEAISTKKVINIFWFHFFLSSNNVRISFVREPRFNIGKLNLILKSTPALKACMAPSDLFSDGKKHISVHCVKHKGTEFFSASLIVSNLATALAILQIIIASHWAKLKIKLKYLVE